MSFLRSLSSAVLLCVLAVFNTHATSSDSLATVGESDDVVATRDNELSDYYAGEGNDFSETQELAADQDEDADEDDDFDDDADLDDDEENDEEAFDFLQDEADDAEEDDDDIDYEDDSEDLSADDKDDEESDDEDLASYGDEDSEYVTEEDAADDFRPVQTKYNDEESIALDSALSFLQVSLREEVISQVKDLDAAIDAETDKLISEFNQLNFDDFYVKDESSDDSASDEEEDTYRRAGERVIRDGVLDESLADSLIQSKGFKGFFKKIAKKGKAIVKKVKDSPVTAIVKKVAANKLVKNVLERALKSKLGNKFIVMKFAYNMATNKGFRNEMLNDAKSLSSSSGRKRLLNKYKNKLKGELLSNVKQGKSLLKQGKYLVKKAQSSRSPKAVVKHYKAVAKNEVKNIRKLANKELKLAKKAYGANSAKYKSIKRKLRKQEKKAQKKVVKALKKEAKKAAKMAKRNCKTGPKRKISANRRRKLNHFRNWGLRLVKRYRRHSKRQWLRLFRLKGKAAAAKYRVKAKSNLKKLRALIRKVLKKARTVAKKATKKSRKELKKKGVVATFAKAYAKQAKQINNLKKLGVNFIRPKISPKTIAKDFSKVLGKARARSVNRKLLAKYRKKHCKRCKHCRPHKIGKINFLKAVAPKAKRAHRRR